MVVSHKLPRCYDTSKLEFQDFPEEKGKVQTHTFTEFPNTAESDEDEVYDKSELLKEEKPGSKASFWTFEYYQQFFDVESTDVLQRVLGSMFPHPNRNYLKTKIRPNPDLYGPFWICTTLVFTTAIAGNLANYMYVGSSGEYHWKYDFHKVSFAATAIFSYWWILPTAIFSFLWFTGNQIGYTFLEILCVYGYSLAIFIPISILWVIQFSWFQWILVIIGTLMSGGVLVFVFLPAVRKTTKKYTWAMIVLIFLLHASLAVGFKLYFFQIPPATTYPLSNSTVSSPQHLTNIDNLTTPQQALQNLKSSINKSSLKEKPLTDESASLKSKQGNHGNTENLKTVESVQGKSDAKPTKHTTLSGKSTTTKIRREQG